MVLKLGASLGALSDGLALRSRDGFVAAIADGIFRADGLSNVVENRCPAFSQWVDTGGSSPDSVVHSRGSISLRVHRRHASPRLGRKYWSTGTPER